MISKSEDNQIRDNAVLKVELNRKSTKDSTNDGIFPRYRQIIKRDIRDKHDDSAVAKMIVACTADYDSHANRNFTRLRKKVGILKAKSKSVYRL